MSKLIISTKQQTLPRRKNKEMNEEPTQPATMDRCNKKIHLPVPTLLVFVSITIGYPSLFCVILGPWRMIASVFLVIAVSILLATCCTEKNIMVNDSEKPI